MSSAQGGSEGKGRLPQARLAGTSPPPETSLPFRQALSLQQSSRAERSGIHAEETAGSATRWLALIIPTAARTSMGFHFQPRPSVAPPLIADLGITYAKVGFLIGLYFLPGGFSLCRVGC
jgi:hypothetical protein